MEKFKMKNIYTSFLLIVIPILVILYLFTFSVNSNFGTLKKGIDLSWTRKSYPNEVSCLDNVAKAFDLKNGISEYWNAKKITETSKSNIWINQVTYNLELLHWMNNLNWYKDNYDERGELKKYNFIIVNTGPDGKEFSSKININIGAATHTVECGSYKILIYNGKDNIKLNDIIGKNIYNFFKSNNVNFINNNNLWNDPFFIDNTSSYWYSHPAKNNINIKLINFDRNHLKDNNEIIKNSKFIRFSSSVDTNYSYLEQRFNINELSGKDFILSFWAKSDSINEKIYPLGYFVPNGVLDKSAIIFHPTSGSPYEITKKWKKYEFNFKVPIFLNSKNNNSYALIRPLSILNKHSPYSFELTDPLMVEIYSFSKPAQFNSFNNPVINNLEAYIAQSDKFNLENNIYREFEAIKIAENIDNNNYKVKWRLSRVHNKLSTISKDDESKNANILLSSEYAFHALGINANVDTLKWWAVMSQKLGAIEGPLQYLKGSHIFYEKINEAINIDRNNAELYLLLGKWNIDMMEMNIFNKIINKFFKLCPIEASYFNAKILFEKGLELDKSNLELNYFYNYTLNKF